MSNKPNNRTTVLKEYYAQYLREVRKLSQTSVKHYYDALNNISRRLQEKGLVERDVYEITDLDYLSYVRDVLYADPDFIDLNERGKRMYSAGLNNYFRFASGEEFQKKIIVSKMDIPLDAVEPDIVTQTIWKRSSILRTQALALADYKCEVDSSHVSFIAEKNNKPFMEGHHAIPITMQPKFDHSLDNYANIVCLCPICHRRIHYGIMDDRIDMLRRIYHSRGERLASSGIQLSCNEFIEIATSKYKPERTC